MKRFRNRTAHYPRDRRGIVGGANTPWAELYALAVSVGLDPSKGELLINDPVFFSIVLGNLQGWAGAWNGRNATELVNPPTVPGNVPTFSGTQYMDWDWTGNTLGNSVTLALGINPTGTVANDLILSRGSANGINNNAGSWAIRDQAAVNHNFGIAMAAALHSIVIQCPNGSPAKLWIDGVLAATAGANFTGGAQGNLMTLMARTSHTNIANGTAPLFCVLDGTSDAASAAIGLWVKAYLGI